MIEREDYSKKQPKPSGSSGLAVQVAVAFAVTFAAVFWILDGAPIPMVRITSLEPNPDIPTFEEMQDGGRSERAKKFMATMASDTEERLLRYSPRQLERVSTMLIPASNVEKVISEYEADECSKKKRHLAMAYITLHLRGGTLNLLDNPNLDASYIEFPINVLFSSGLLTLDDFGPRTQKKLKKFVPDGSTQDIQRIKKCQRGGW